MGGHCGKVTESRRFGPVPPFRTVATGHLACRTRHVRLPFTFPELQIFSLVLYRAARNTGHATYNRAALRVVALQHTLGRQVVRFRAESVASAAALATDCGESARRSEAHETGLRKVSGLSHLAVPT